MNAGKYFRRWNASIEAWLFLHYSRWQASRIKISLDEKCPSCGHRRGRIEFDAQAKRVNHYCLVDGYVWSEPTVMEIPDAETD